MQEKCWQLGAVSYLILFILCTVIIIIYIHQQMYIKYNKLQIIYKHKLSYMFQQMFTILRQTTIHRIYTSIIVRGLEF